jgi:glycosyltransferase involved in cell wall biosynthesis
MKSPRLSLICPTIGRTTLKRTIGSVILQLKEGDEFIIVADGPCPDLHDLIGEVQQHFPQVRYYELPVRVGDFGCTPCDAGMQRATGDFVFFIGDDDICEPGAFEVIRTAVALQPTVPHVFAMMHTGRKLSGTIAPCYVSGQQIVVPRDVKRIPRMANCPATHITVSDAVFIEAVYNEWGRVVFHDDVIATLPYQNMGRFE